MSISPKDFQRWFDNACTDIRHHFAKNVDGYSVSLLLGMTDEDVTEACAAFDKSFPDLTATCVTGFIRENVIVVKTRSKSDLVPKSVAKSSTCDPWAPPIRPPGYKFTPQ